jgi:hypothetical protein
MKHLVQATTTYPPQGIFAYVSVSLSRNSLKIFSWDFSHDFSIFRAFEAGPSTFSAVFSWLFYTRFNGVLSALNRAFYHMLLFMNNVT